MPAVNTDDGTILEALNDKLDRDGNNLDTASVDFDVVVEWQVPTSENNYTWYRKYSSGWVEQGGLVSTPNDAEMTINLPITMADTYYNLSLGSREQADSTALTGTNSRWDAYWDKSTTLFKCWGKWGTTTEISWEVKGIAASNI